MSNGVNILNESQASVVLVKLDAGDIGQESGLLPVRSETLLGSDARSAPAATRTTLANLLRLLTSPCGDTQRPSQSAP